MVDNLPKGVAVDLTGQMGPTEENIDDNTIMEGPPDETDPSGEPENPPEHESDQDAPESESDQILSCPSLIKSYG